MRNILIVLASLFILSSCKKDGEGTYNNKSPLCVQETIKQMNSLPIKSCEFIQILSYKYNNATTYLFVRNCCDQYNDLLDDKCNYLFSPSGGITGGGDMTHPDFKTNAIYLGEVWKR